MLYLDLKKVMADRGIDYPNKFLHAHGFTDVMASNMVRGKMKGTSWKNIEQLCLALNCSPTELFSWQPDEGVTVAPNHPLQKLVVTEDAGALGRQIRALSPEKIEQLRGFVKDLAQDKK